ncbi:MAG: DeoR/GlpR transcriptional regulator [Firmicutes bacterium]|nr:DeoR/GlpR transcriptional regulator [Bacillota bacterium]
MSMLAMDRRTIILERIQQNSSVRVTELAQEFQVTEETIRRDLEKLEAEGLVTRTYGGAVLVQSGTTDLSIHVRETQNTEGKRRIAMKVAEMIEDGDTLMVDSSTTSMFVARHLKGRSNITMITNSVRIPQEVAVQENIKIILTGGVLRPSIMSMVGTVTEHALDRYYVNKAIIGCKALEVEAGTYEPHERESIIKKKMRQNARTVILVADHTKFGKKSFVRTLGIADIDILVTDAPLDAKAEQILKEKGVQVVYA